MMIKIGPYSFGDFVHQVEKFHGFPAPGVVLGGVMVDLVVKHLPPRILYDAICETDKCLPDAIQLLTPCTIGNSWLEIKPWGRFALALFDKRSGNGIRVCLDAARLEEWPEIKTWYYKLKSKEETDRARLLDAIQKSGYEICRLQDIRVHPDRLIKKTRGKRVRCPQCGEFFPTNETGICAACQGESRSVYLTK